MVWKIIFYSFLPALSSFLLLLVKWWVPGLPLSVGFYAGMVMATLILPWIREKKYLAAIETSGSGHIIHFYTSRFRRGSIVVADREISLLQLTGSRVAWYAWPVLEWIDSVKVVSWLIVDKNLFRQAKALVETRHS